MIRDPELIIQVKMVPVCNPAADRALLCLYCLKDAEKKSHKLLHHLKSSFQNNYLEVQGKSHR